MTVSEYIAWGMIIFISDITAVFAYEGYKHWRDRLLDINCSNCKKPLPLTLTPDKAYFLCRTCMKRYIEENKDKFTEEEIKKSEKGYRRKKHKQ